MAVVVVENGKRPFVNICVIRQYLCYLCNIQLSYPCVFVQCSVILSLCFCAKCKVYILARPNVPGKVNFSQFINHILNSKANDSVKIKPNKSSSIGMLSVWLSAPEPGIGEV